MSKEIITIVEATVADIPAIKKIAYSTWPAAYTHIVGEKQVEYMLQLFYSKEALQKQITEGHKFTLAKNNEESVGFASYNLIIQPDIYKLQKLYALPSQQGKGLGKKLLDYIFNELKKQNAKSLRLNVNRNNNAVEFYKHLGFTIIYEENIPIGNDFFMNDYVMEKLCD